MSEWPETLTELQLAKLTSRNSYYVKQSEFKRQCQRVYRMVLSVARTDIKMRYVTFLPGDEYEAIGKLGKDAIELLCEYAADATGTNDNSV